MENKIRRAQRDTTACADRLAGDRGA